LFYAIGAGWDACLARSPWEKANKISLLCKSLFFVVNPTTFRVGLAREVAVRRLTRESDLVLAPFVFLPMLFCQLKTTIFDTEVVYGFAVDNVIQ
jgi:hypothetical protein